MRCKEGRHNGYVPFVREMRATNTTASEEDADSNDKINDIVSSYASNIIIIFCVL